MLAQLGVDQGRDLRSGFEGLGHPRLREALPQTVPVGFELITEKAPTEAAATNYVSFSGVLRTLRLGDNTRS